MDIDKIKKNVLNEIDRTNALIIEYKEMTQPVAPDNAYGRLSRMDAIINKSVTESSLRKTEEKLSDLKKVLDKIDSKDFGLCANCREPIPEARILFMPESLYCVKCTKK